GAPSGTGAVYVYSREGHGWALQHRLTAANAGEADRFGQSLSLSADGHVLAVGASHEDSGSRTPNAGAAEDSAPDSGAAYVFTRASGGWTQQAYLKAANA